MFRIIICFAFLISNHALANDNKKICSSELKAQLVTLADNPDEPIPSAELKTILVELAACLDEVATTPISLPVVEGAAAPLYGEGEE